MGGAGSGGNGVSAFALAEALLGFAAGWLGAFVATCLCWRQTREDERREWIAEGMRRQRLADETRLREIVRRMDARRLLDEPAYRRRVRSAAERTGR